jgi:hypothetical protein
MFLRNGGSETLGSLSSNIYDQLVIDCKTCMGSRTSSEAGKDDDETNENQDEENEDAPFWTDRTAAHKRLAERMCGEKTLLNLHAAVGYTSTLPARNYLRSAAVCARQERLMSSTVRSRFPTHG